VVYSQRDMFNNCLYGKHGTVTEINKTKGLVHVLFDNEEKETLVFGSSLERERSEGVTSAH